MANRLEEIAFSFETVAPPSHLTEALSDAEALRDAFYDRKGADRIPAFTGTDPLIAWSILSCLRDQVPDFGETFCEWGSGLGVVTCVAEGLGWRASGLEIDPRLVEAANAFADKHGFDAKFRVGSYREDNAGMKPDPGLFDTDVIFAYTWPAEIESVTEIVRGSARPGTLFVRYLGGIQVSVFRVIADC